MTTFDFEARVAYAKNLPSYPRASAAPSFKNSHLLTQEALIESIGLASGGDKDAAFKVAKYYRWTVRDIDEAFVWEEIAASLGHSTAQYNLASRALEAGDFAKALHWAQAALASGEADAQQLIDEARNGLAK